MKWSKRNKALPKKEQVAPSAPAPNDFDKEMSELKELMKAYVIQVRLERQLLRLLVKKHPEIMEGLPEDFRQTVDLWGIENR